MEINKREVLRYLGYKRDSVIDDAVMQMVNDCIDVIGQTANTKSISKRCPLEFGEDNLITMADITVRSKSLSKNLKDCEEVIFFAATLGTDVDRMLNRYIKLDMARAAVFQATAAAAIESYCDECQRAIEEEMAREGLFVRPRFSPGYGDLPLNIQGQFLDVLNTRKYIGVFLSEGDIMLPEKSVSAVMGLTRTNSRCVLAGCEACGKADCAYRR